jgi:hypothetical protein
MTCRPPSSPVLMKSVGLVARAVTTEEAPVPVLTGPLPVAHVVRLAPLPRPLTAATNPQRPPLAPMPRKPPLSAFAKSPRQLQQLTVPKENKHAATCSQKVPQGAKRP